MKRRLLLVPVLLAASPILAGEAPAPERPSETVAAPAPGGEEAKELSGISILGNQEAPKSLVIVPWKTSLPGESLGITPMLDDSKQPVDRDVFLRALTYYGIRSETTHHDGAPAGRRRSS